MPRAGASRVFARHGLDFCCHGQVSVLDTCATKGMDVTALLAELEAEERVDESFESWTGRSDDELIDHLLSHFHEAHRAEVPRLHAMAAKVERVHAEKPACPHGLAHGLAAMAESLEAHMEKEEEVVFPLLRRGAGRVVVGAIQVMEQEHEDHGASLARLRGLTDDYTPPPGACRTWTALYLGLAQLERDLMTHISLENNLLFPRAMAREHTREGRVGCREVEQASAWRQGGGDVVGRTPVVSGSARRSARGLGRGAPGRGARPHASCRTDLAWRARPIRS